MEATVFNPIQQHLLRMFSFNNSEEALQEMKSVLTAYYAKKVEKTFDQLWDDGVLDQKKLDELRTQDLHQLYLKKL
jgi:tRNA G18 (ribose-2'-O)-methylase SpoU